MDTTSSLQKLKDLTIKLESLNGTLMCPVVPEETRIQNLSLQYDLFMEFIGEYEDLMNTLDSIPITADNQLEIKRIKKEVDKYFKYNSISAAF